MSVWIAVRLTLSGKRYTVRYRLGGRGYKEHWAGSFKTRREAQIRRDLVAGEIAAGRDPKATLDALRKPQEPETLAVWLDRWYASRVDLAPGSHQNRVHAVKKLKNLAGHRDPRTMTIAEVQELVGTLAADLAPATIQSYMAVLKQTLDFADVEPNPARDRRVKLPRIVKAPPNVPSARDVATIRRHLPRKLHAPFDWLEQTGMRIQDAVGAEWQDVDAQRSRIRIRLGKTRAATRWVSVPEPLMRALLDSVPPDDRVPERRLFPGLTDATMRNAMRRACVAGGVAHFHPHDLRHRYISVMLKRGMSRAEVQAQVGHASPQQLAVYEHVVLEEEA